jgi:hypothetical protein
MYSCEKDDGSIVDPILYFPVIDSVYLTPTAFDTNRIEISINAKVSSVDPISSVKAKIIDPLGSQVTEVDLVLNGEFYTFNAVVAPACIILGNYKVEFLAVTNSGLNSNTVTNTFEVTNSNSIKPTVSIVYAPDSLLRPTGSELVPAFLQVQVNDPDGICDIEWARFNAVNPNGIPNPSNPFTMYDNGNPLPPFSDTVANDGKYSLTIYISSQATLGDFSFKFFAKDRSDLTSDTLLKLINVHE